MLNFVRGFFCIYWDNHMAFIFQFVNMEYHIDWFACIEESLHPWIKPSWSWCMNFLICVEFCLLKFCWGVLHLCSLVILACIFLFVVVVFVWFWYEGDGRLEKWALKCSFLNFLKSFRRIGISFSLNLDRILLWSHLVLGFCFLGDILSHLRFQCL